MQIFLAVRKDVNILIIDNRNFFIQNIKYLLNRYFTKNYRFKFHVKTNYTDAIEALEKFKREITQMDIIVLNIDINYRNSFGLILVKKYIRKIKKCFPETKIIITTCRNENFRINQIVKNKNTFATIIENQTSENELNKIFHHVFDSKEFIPKSTLSIINRYRSNFIDLDEINYHILYFLNIGIKTNYLQNYIPLSNSAIEKRKYKLKDEFGYDKCSDEQLIKEAIKRDIL